MKIRDSGPMPNGGNVCIISDRVSGIDHLGLSPYHPYPVGQARGMGYFDSQDGAVRGGVLPIIGAQRGTSQVYWPAGGLVSVG